MGEVHRLSVARVSFGLQSAGRLMTEVFPPWVQDLVESVEVVRPSGALADWQPGATVRLPYSKKLCSHGAAIRTQALALADTAMALACSAAWNGYRPMASIDQTTHFLRPVNFDVIADARWCGSAATQALAGSCCSMPPIGVRSVWWQAPMRWREMGEYRVANRKQAGSLVHRSSFRLFAFH
jgi:hypothetical protein